MALETVITIAGSLTTIIGLFLIWYQVKSARKDSITGSLVSAINDHWKIIEERKMRIRTGKEKVYYPALYPVLDGLLESKYDCNLSALAKDYLFDFEKIRSEKKKVFKAIEREYAYQDITFNFMRRNFLPENI